MRTRRAKSLYFSHASPSVRRAPVERFRLMTIFRDVENIYSFLFSYFLLPLLKMPIFRLMKPDKGAQTEALWRAISDILWKIGDKKKVIVALPQETAYVSHSVAYFQDSVTEKVCMEAYTGTIRPM